MTPFITCETTIIVIRGALGIKIIKEPTAIKNVYIPMNCGVKGYIRGYQQGCVLGIFSENS
jgi:hypothetical protein